MRNILLFVLLIAALGSGCTSVRDARGQSEVCEVHHAFMRSVKLPGPKSAVQLPKEYVAAEYKSFPHAMPDYTPDYRHKVVLYICDDCVRAQKAWKRDHPGMVPED